MELKPYLVDVPVKTNIWTREDCQKKQFEIIKQARPSILFIQSDGGRNEQEMEIIRRNRKMIDEGIDWDCTVYRLYEEENKGMYTMGLSVEKFVWETVDRCIFLEDDILPTVGFFTYCAELLEKYKDDQRIECICGMNHLGVHDDVESDYFFSRQGSIWGVATWKRVADEMSSFDYGNDQYVMNLLKQRTKKNKIAWERLNAYHKQSTFEGHVPGTEFWYEFHMYSQNRLQIVPKRNMINNIGFGDSSAHFDTLNKMPKSIRNLFNMETYELDGPINHAKYVIPDLEYEKKRNDILLYGSSWHIFWAKKFEFVRCLFSGNFKTVWRVLKNKFKRSKGDKKVEK